MKSYSQHNQDLFVYEKFFKSKKVGFFFESGTVGGIDISNTLLFEKLGWSGLLVECNPKYFLQTKANRKSIVENYAISPVEEPLLFLDAAYLGGLLRFMPQNQFRQIENWYRDSKPNIPTIWVNGMRLQSIFDKHSIKSIDYFSLDIEGAELEAIQTIDFEKTNISVMTIEYKSQDKNLTNFLNSKEFYFFDKVGADFVYVNKDFKYE